MVGVTVVAVLCAAARWIANRLATPVEVELISQPRPISPGEIEALRQLQIRMKEDLDTLESLRRLRPVAQPLRDMKFPPSHIQFKSESDSDRETSDPRIENARLRAYIRAENALQDKNLEQGGTRVGDRLEISVP